MRHTLAILLLLASVSGVQARFCHRGYYSGPVCAAPAVYVAPYWSPVIYYPSVWVSPAEYAYPQPAAREVLPPPQTPSSEGTGPRIKNPRLPTEDVEPKKTSPAPKAVPPAKTEESKAKEKEKSVTVDQFLIPAEKTRAEPPAEVKVGIFNHSDREMELEINGEAVKLPADQYVTLRLSRTFTWAVKGQAVKEVKVPADADGLEIVFRR